LPLGVLSILGAVLLHLAMSRALERGHDARLASQLEALLAGLDVDASGQPRLKRPLPEAGYATIGSGWTWQVDDASGAVLTSRSLWDATLVLGDWPADRKLRHDDLIGPGGQRLRAASRRVKLGGTGSDWQLTVTLPRADLDAEIARFRSLLAAGTVGILLVAALALAIQLQLGLQPLARLNQQLRDIQQGRRESLQAGHGTELDELAGEINDALHQNRALAERSRRLAGDLAHALKTPLSRLRLALPVEAGEARRALDAVQAVIDRQLARASAEARSVHAQAPLAPVCEALAALFRRLHAARGLTVTVAVPAVMVAGERADLEELLGNLLDNACRMAAREVRLTGLIEAGEVRLTLEDDGPGVEPEHLAGLGQRGQRLDERSEHGLGLAIALDLVEALGGRIIFAAAATGGLRVVVWLPRRAG
jgi:signal transduction histidine kinase